MNGSAKKPRLRKAAKRYVQCIKTPYKTENQIIKNRFHETLLNYERNSDNGSHDFNSIEFKLLC